MAELELKFQVPPERRNEVMRAMKAGRVERIHLQARYHDTEDDLLGQNRLALRLRQEGRAWVQTLKGSTGHVAERAEHDVALSRVPRGGPTLDVNRHADSAVGQALLALLRDHPEATLQQVYATDVWRTHRVVAHQGARIELAFDEGRIVAGEAEHPLCELEFELKSGPPAALFDLALRWCERHGLWLDSVSKAQRGQLLARGRRHAEPVAAQAPAIRRDTGAAHVLAHVVNSTLQQILPNSSEVASEAASEVAGGSATAEHVHQLRVGLRRLRTALRELKSLGPSPCTPEDTSALEHAFAQLGMARDQQVALEHIVPMLEAAGAPWTVGPATAQHATRAADVVRASGFQMVLVRLLATTFVSLREPDDRAPPANHIARRLHKLHRRVAQAADGFAELPVAEQHQTRKRLKRLRYLAEFAAPLFKAKSVDRYLAALKPAQDALGLLNDQATAEAAYRQWAATEPRAWFAAGWLAGRHEASARQCGRALRRVAEAKPFWHG